MLIAGIIIFSYLLGMCGTFFVMGLLDGDEDATILAILWPAVAVSGCAVLVANRMRELGIAVRERFERK